MTRQSLVAAGEGLLERDEVVEALAHLLAVHGDHVVVEPVPHEGRIVGGLGLGDLALVVGELVLQSAAVDVDGLAEVLHAHDRAFEVPAGETHPPGAGPLHDVVGLGLLPEGEIDGVLLVRRRLDAGPGDHLVDIPAGELAVRFELRDVEIDRAVHLVGVALLQQRLDQLDLLDDVAAGPRADIGTNAVELVHVLEIAARVILGQLHRVLSLLPGRLGDLVLALVRIVGQMADVGDVLHVGDAVPEIAQVPHEHIETDVALGVAQMGVPVYGRPANVHPHPPLLQRLEFILPSRQAVV